MSETKATYQAGEPVTTRDLLTRWAELEPERCRLNLNWKPANGDNNYYIAIQTDDSEGWQLVYSDSESNYYFPDRNEALGRIQWAVQEAIVNRGWTFNLEWDEEWYVWIDDKWTGQDLDSPVKAILEAYLAALESNQ